MLAGGYIVRGLGITLRRLLMSYVDDLKRLTGRRREIDRVDGKVKQHPGHEGIFTIQYPEERPQTPERLRILPMLLYDEEDGNVRCTSCGICAKVCPPQCIWIVQAKNPDGKPFPKPAAFTIDMDVCMNCGFCAEFCPFDAIKMDHNYELSNSERQKTHVYNLQDLLTSTSYYARTHPTAWAEEQQKAKAKEKVA